MSAIHRILRRIVQIGWALRFVPWSKVMRQRDATSSNVLWIHHRYPDSWFRYLTNEETILKDLALLAAVADSGASFRIVTGNAIGSATNSTILYSIDQFNPIGAQNYSAALVATLSQLESQGNVLFPPLEAASLWENKVEMHARFDECGVNSPQTTAVTRDEVASAVAAEVGIEFPLLAKEPHSCNSAGVHKVDSAEALDGLWSELVAAGHSDLLIQRLVSMTSDMRVIVIGDEIALHFMRINREKGEWHPTSIQKWSEADYATFPEQWRQPIIDTLHSLGLRNGAFDVCWENDDTDGDPIFLEVSPAYHPSPAPPEAFAHRPYAEFMATLTGPHSYPKAFVSTIFDFQRRVLLASSIL